MLRMNSQAYFSEAPIPGYSSVTVGISEPDQSNVDLVRSAISTKSKNKKTTPKHLVSYLFS